MQPFTEHNINNNPPGLKARAWPTKKPTKHIRSVNTVKNARQDRNVVASNTNQKTAQQQQHNLRKRRPNSTNTKPSGSGRTSWMNQGSSLNASRGPGTGIYGRPSKSNNSKRNNSTTTTTTTTEQTDRDELISLRVEYQAQEHLVAMLTNRVNKMTTEVERSKLVSRAMETQLIQSQQNTQRANESYVQSKQEETIVGDQLDQYKYDLEEVQEQNNRLQSELSQIKHERDTALSQISMLTQQQKEKEQNNNRSTTSLQEMHGMNAGLRRQLSNEQNRIVEARNEVRTVQSEVQRVYMELSTRDSELKNEQMKNENMVEKINNCEDLIHKLKEKIMKITCTLNKAQDVRKTAIKRAEVTASKAKKMEHEVASTDKIVADYELKINNLIGQITMKDRRIQLMKKQHYNEIENHKGTMAEREALEEEVVHLTKDLNLAEGALNQRALEVVRRGGPVLEGREDPRMRDSLDGSTPSNVKRRNGKKNISDFNTPITMEEAMRMGGGVGGVGGVTKKKRIATKGKKVINRVSFGGVPGSNVRSSNSNNSNNNSMVPKAPKAAVMKNPPVAVLNNGKMKLNKKKSRKENLAAIRQMTSSMPDAAKLPGSDAPAWMQDDDHDIM